MKKQFLFAITVLSLLVAASVGFFNTALGQKKSASKEPASDFRISGPYTHKNLTIFLVHGKGILEGHSFLTLQEALAQKKVIVYETKDVNELAIKKSLQRGHLRSSRRHRPRRRPGSNDLDRLH